MTLLLRTALSCHIVRAALRRPLLRRKLQRGEERRRGRNDI